MSTRASRAQKKLDESHRNSIYQRMQLDVSLVLVVRCTRTAS